MGTKNKPCKFACYANAHPDEPMFVLLGRDPYAPDLVEAWADRREAQRGRDAKTLEARTCALHMRAWQARGTNAVRLIVNGQPCEVAAVELSYDGIVALAGMSGHPSVTWRDRERGNSGVMMPGADEMALQDGMVFYVAHTGNA